MPGGLLPLLDAVQRDSAREGGDRHAIVINPTNRMFNEFSQLKKTARGWQAAQSSVFDLKSNKLQLEKIELIAARAEVSR